MYTRHPHERRAPSMELDLTLEKNSLLIKSLIQRYPSTPYFAAGSSFFIENQRIILKQTLIRHQKPLYLLKTADQKKFVRHYLVIKPKPLGEGNYGCVQEVEGKWKIRDHTFFYKEKSAPKKWVIKSTKNIHPAFQAKHTARLKIEQKISALTPHLDAKYPVFTSLGRAHLLLRKQPGMRLTQFISWQNKNMPTLNWMQYLLLCTHLLEQYEHQVRRILWGPPGKKHPIVHRDIKPDNLLINFDSLIPEINFIDYGFATYDGYLNKESKIMGTPLYIDPDYYTHEHQPVTEQNDLFALFLIFAELAGDNGRDTIEETYTLEKANTNITFPLLGQNLQHQDPALHRILELLLLEGTRFKRSDRGQWSVHDIHWWFHELVHQCLQKITAPVVIQERVQELFQKLNTAPMNTKERNQLYKEFLAAQFLSEIVQKVPHNLFHSELSLQQIWMQYRDAQIDHLQKKLAACDNSSVNGLYIKKVAQFLEECLIYRNILNPPLLLKLAEKVALITEENDQNISCKL
ncbi:MAG: hypothetical protein J0I93_09345 [Legionella sp.]|nr:hypothetical protein [Legionella sp.]